MAHLSSFLTVALAAGVAGGVMIEAPVALPLALLMSAAWATALLTYLRGIVPAQVTALCVLTAGAGWVLGAHAVDAAQHSPLRGVLEERADDAPIVVEGRLRDDAALTSSGAVFRLDVERVGVHGTMQTAAGGVALGVGGAMQSASLGQWTAGRTVRAPALLHRPARFLNAGVPDQERAMAMRGIALVGTIKSAALIDVVEPGAWWQEAAATIRARTRLALERHIAVRSAQSAAIATAILIGDRAALTLDLQRRLQEAGTYHVIAISGGNIAILAAVCLGALHGFGVRGRVAWIGVIGVLTGYSVIAMGGASVLRATLMAVIYLAVRVIDQRTAAANAVSLTAAIVLLAAPLSIVDVGFWFTFGATIALLAGTQAVSTKGTKDLIDGGSSTAPLLHLRRNGAAVRRLMAAVSMLLIGTICVELALTPVAAFVFQRVTIAGPLLNLVAIPAMTVVQIGAMGVVAFDVAGLERLAGWCGAGVHAASVALTDSARVLDYAPWLTWRTLSPSPAVMAAYYLAAAVALLPWNAEWHWPLRRVAGVAAAALFIWIIAAPQARVRANGDGRLHLTVLDVGQGDAMLATFPNGRTLLVDTGASSASGEFDIGERVIGPALRARALLAVDFLAITHGDPDHLGGAQTLVRDFVGREVWWGVPVANHAPTAVVREQADRQRLPWRTVQRGDRLDIGDVEVRVHHPPPPDWERQRVRNDDSLVLELRFGTVSLLLTGDIGRDVERDLVPHLDLLPLRVLKVAHHGSATSSSHAFLEHTRPHIALIGVGRRNLYGHPVPQVLGRLYDTGTEIFRTDLDGQIEVITDGRDLEVRTFTGRIYESKASKATKASKKEAKLAKETKE